MRHAVVVGGSMAGLLAAQVLSEQYDRVTVVDRDDLPQQPVDRRAVPQGRHAHSLLPHGQDCLEELLPGFGEELGAAGAVPTKRIEEMRLVVGGHEIMRLATGTHSLYASRPLIETHIRQRVRATANVEVRDRCEAAGLTASPDAGRITGVHVVARDGDAPPQTIEADLVLVATGRGARVPAWLEALGSARPVEERLQIDLRYASRHIRLPADGMLGDKMLLVTATPERPTALFVFPQEGGRYIMSTGGYGAAHHPPTDHAGLSAYAAAAAPEDLREVIREAEPTDDIVTQGFPAHVRRRYDLLDRLPEGLAVAGDAVCSFNPTYGQGMTVAAAEAVALRACLAEGPEGLGRRHLAASAPAVEHAWRMATYSDLDLPQVVAERPPEVREMAEHMRRVRVGATHDPMVAGTLAGVMSMQAPYAALTAPALRERLAAPA